MKIRNIFITILIVMACINQRAHGMMMRSIRKVCPQTARTSIFAQPRTFVSGNEYTSNIQPTPEDYQTSNSIVPRHEIMDVQTSSHQSQTGYPIFHIIEYRSNPDCPDTMEVTQESWEMTEESLQRAQQACPEEREKSTYTFSINIDTSNRPIEGPIIYMFDHWIREIPAIRVVTMIVTSTGEMVGYIAYIIHEKTDRDEHVASIEKIFVAPQFRRKGIGKALMRLGYFDCVNHSVNYVNYFMQGIDRDLISFFQKCGFKDEYNPVLSYTRNMPVIIYKKWLKKAPDKTMIEKTIEDLIDSILETNIAKKTIEKFVDMIEAIENDTIVDRTFEQIQKVYDRFKTFRE